MIANEQEMAIVGDELRAFGVNTNLGGFQEKPDTRKHKTAV